MSIGTDYSRPVTVNGFSCKNCMDVDYAKKHIDPAHPKSGPYGINAKNDPTVQRTQSPAIIFSGSLGGPDGKKSVVPAPLEGNRTNAELAATAASATVGSLVNVSV